MAEVASAVVALMPSFRGGAAAISRELGGPAEKAGRDGGKAAGQGFGSSFVSVARSLIGPLLATIGTAQIFSFLRDAKDEAATLEQAIGAVDSVFGESAGSIHQWALSAADDAGLSQSAYSNLAVVLGAQLKNMGIPMEEVAGQTGELVTMGSDLAAMFGGTTSEAVEALSSLLRGERDPIERYGVSINEAAIQAKMAEMGLDGLSGEAEKNAKLQATLALLTEQTADAQGQFARETDTAAGAQQIAAANADNLRAKIGNQLLPAWTALMTFVSGTLIPGLESFGSWITGTGIPALQSFAGWISQNSTTIGIIAGVIGTLLIPVFIRLGVQATIAAAKQVAAWAVSSAGAVRTAALYVIQSARIVASWIAMGFAAVRSGAQTVAIWALYRLDAIRSVGVMVAQAARHAAAWALMAARSAANAVRMALSWTIGVITPAAAATAAMVANVARQVAAWVLLGAQSLIQAARVAAAWLIAMGPIGIVIAAVIGLVVLIVANWDKIWAATKRIWGNITGWLSRQWNKVKATATAVWNAIVSFITGVPGRIMDGLRFLGNLASEAASWFGGVKDSAMDKLGELVDWVRGIPDRILSALGSLGNLLRDAGLSVIQGFLDGIMARFNSVRDTLSNLTSLLPDWKGPADRDATILTNAGHLVMGGFIDGLESQYGQVQRSLQGLTGSLSANVNVASAVRREPEGWRAPQQTFNITAADPNAAAAAFSREVQYQMMGAR